MQLARRLLELFAANKVAMPEDILPLGMQKGSIEHLLFITLTVSIDYQRDAPALWKSSRKTFEDIKTRYLFYPKAVYGSPLDKIVEDMQKHKLSKKPDKDAKIWSQNAITFFKKWDGDPRNFLKDCDFDSLTILKRLKSDNHVSDGKSIVDYPYLRGNKIGPLWIRMLRDNVGISNLNNLDKVPIPVDIHVARATLATGIVKGKFEGDLTAIFDYVREAWFESVRNMKIKDRPMIALDLDEPLWHLSKYGCTKRNKTTNHCLMSGKCKVETFCVDGKVNLNNNYVELET